MDAIGRHGERILVGLQNAYDKGELKRGWSPSRWRSEFESSRTGRRLGLLLGDGLSSVRIMNVAGSAVGNGAHSVLQPNRAHVRRTLRRVVPLLVVACGRIAEAACAEAWAGPLVALPHPAYKLLTNDLLGAAYRLIVHWLTCCGGAEGNVEWSEDVARQTARQLGCEAAWTAEEFRGVQPLRVAFRQRRGRYEVERLENGGG